VEVCEGTSATNESNMGVSDSDAISIMSSIDRNSYIIMARTEHIRVGNAKVRSPESADRCRYFTRIKLSNIPPPACRFYCWGPSKPPMQMTANEVADWNAHLQTPVLFNHHEPIVVNSTTIKRVDLNAIESTPKALTNEERILILTPLRDAALYLPGYFDLLSLLTYPHHLIDLGFLVGDSTDDTLAVLAAELDRIQRQHSDTLPFHSVLIVEKDFGASTSQSVEERHGFEAQAPRRKIMARARNYLLTAALKPEHSWVYWRDSDIVDSPASIIEDFVAHDKDIIVPSMSTLFSFSFGDSH